MPIAATSEQRLTELGVRYVCEPLNRTESPYLSINRIVAASWCETNLAEPYVAVLDSDVLFTGPPAFVRADAGVRPVDMKGSASSGRDDPLDAYWSSMCAIAGISLDALPLLAASIERVSIRASYNGGFCIARRDRGIFAETHRVFEESRRRDLRPLRGSGLSVRASTGFVGTAASEWWGSSQAALSVAIYARSRDVLTYDERYNIPLHLIATAPDVPVGWAAVDPILVHYHWLLETEHRPEFLRRLAVVGASDEFRAWLSLRCAND